MDIELKLAIDVLQSDLKNKYGMTPSDVCYILGISRRTYYNWRSGTEFYQNKLISEMRDLIKIMEA